MLFNSMHFMLFFPIVLGLCYLFSASRGPILLLASVIFYMAAIPQYIMVLFALILIDYYAALEMEGASPKRRLNYLRLSLFGNLALLFSFKYFNFANTNLSALFEVVGLNFSPLQLSPILPIGLSFHTFQSLSYSLEVYYGRERAEKNLLIYALYVLFFPQLVAGPIERPQHLLPQLRALFANQIRRYSHADMAAGLQRMLWGFFKKLAIADRVAPYVDGVYRYPNEYSGAALWLALFFFGVQIYCDFSGYCDIAIGAAQTLGINLRENFSKPYFALSLRDFWGCWHISLTSWFRDYVYIPLGGNRGSSWLKCRNIFIVFLLSGLWHGASWNFLAWGLLHATFYISFQIIFERMRWLPRIIELLFTFVFVNLAWVLFRAPSFSEAAMIYKHLLKTSTGSTPSFIELSISLGLIGFLFSIELLSENKRVLANLLKLPSRIYWCWSYLLVLFILFFGEFSEQQFIYFHF